MAPDVKKAELEPLAALDASIRRGLADAEAGRTKPAEDVFGGLERKHQAWPITKVTTKISPRRQSGRAGKLRHRN